MRLIDADDLDRVILELNTERGCKITRNEYKLIDRVLFEFPTIKALEQEPMLDKIRAEIEEMTPTYHNLDWSITDLVPINKVLKIIDKIRDEITKLVYGDPEEDYEYGYNRALMNAAQIINKYKAEPIIKDGERNIDVLLRILDLYFPDTFSIESFNNVMGLNYHLIFNKLWLEKKYKKGGGDNAE